MASDIKIVSLTATPAVGGFALAALAAPPAIQASLPYMQPASIVFYAAATNSFGAATIVAESPAVGLAQVGGVGNGVTRYVWARAKDAAGNLGDRYPTGGGVAVTTLNPAPGPNSVGPDELQSGAVQTTHIANLAVTSAKILSLAAEKISAGVISALIEILGPTITGGIIRTNSGSTRAEITQSQNSLMVYNAGDLVGRFGTITGSGVLTVTSSGMAGTLTGNLSHATLSAVQITNFGNGSGLYATSGGTGSFSHGFRAKGSNAGGAGGMGIVGVAALAGGYAFYAETGNYGPFTGTHDALLPLGEAITPGEIVCSTGRVISRSGVDDALLEVEVAAAEQQRGAYGIVSLAQPFDPFSGIAALPPVHGDDPPTPIRLWIATNYQRLSVNGCGEGLVLVCGRGGDIALGDYICTSSMRGKGQRQNDDSGAADDLLRRHTVAQATQSVSFDDPDEVRLVACIYKCG